MNKTIVAVVIVIVMYSVGMGVWNWSHGYTTKVTSIATIDGVQVQCAHPAKDVYVCEPLIKE